ncbi:hypothetical protein YYG_01249 [Plasmodium vinckei petteri]|uniref:Programmed cell death protein 2 C-terminal domain-containing protein n=1 Tax=Plasmodium vinckei petteri TaxID=138298 RepID=W7AX60_PLAVN|nr:hypothetical protein YYG_01249 [Plasmodium vinckei petteri]CAD2108302.1 conserved Plasmodium protein, unknown function [Plasmodium vinckei petteri]
MYIGVLSDEVDSNFDLKNDSKFGGDPVWLCGTNSTVFNLKCSTCKKNLTFLFQLSTPYDTYIRVLYIFCCMNSAKCNMNKNNWVCIKGKKKMCENLENIEIVESPINNSSISELNNQKNTEKNDMSIYPMTYNNNNSKENVDSKPTNSLNESIKREDSSIHIINPQPEKLIDWNTLFSKNTKSQNTNGSSLSNCINESLNYANEKIKNDNISYSNKNASKNYNNKCKSVNKNHQMNNKQNELNQINKQTGTNNITLNDVDMDNVKLPCYYISLIEDDEECGNDYLYEKATKMYQSYEKNMNTINEDEELNDNGNMDNGSDKDNVELFENDFNGYVKFYSYLSKNYNQILRYSYKGKFLYIYKHTKKQLKGKNMICSHCKNKLVFELQLFSTFVYQIEKILEKTSNNALKKLLNNFNVGNVIIFTCEKDCVVIDNTYSYEHIEFEIF